MPRLVTSNDKDNKNVRICFWHALFRLSFRVLGLGLEGLVLQLVANHVSKLSRLMLNGTKLAAGAGHADNPPRNGKLKLSQAKQEAIGTHYYLPTIALSPINLQQLTLNRQPLKPKPLKTTKPP